ncbi:MAG: cupin domain-containing protein [Helicobacteraceae bacterium]|jgi:quercetin dioxygenase-like cupin family protein|nr:cupin domain-containing protein [Helicobacteraceae bacterium]
MTAFEAASVYIGGDKIRDASAAAWTAHPKFDGVYTKSLIGCDESGKGLNAMLVKIEPNSAIGNHMHGKEAELHEVIYGEGEARIGELSAEYKTGAISLIPPDTPHSVKAFNSGLVMIAIFAPSERQRDL